MATTVEELKLAIKAEVSDAVKKLQQYRRESKETESSTKSLGKTFASMRDVMQGPVAAFTKGIAIFNKVRAEVDKLESAWETQINSVAILESVMQTTGATSWTTSKHLQDLASQLQSMTTYGDETILTMQGILLGFRNIKGDNFDRATKAILDMSTVMKIDLRSAAQVVGKALDDPEKGLDSLRRQGFQFTEQEKKMLIAMKESGDMAGAQNYILSELEKTYGGTSEAVAKTATGIKTQLKNAIGDMNEQLGRSASEGLKGFRLAMMNIVEAITKSAKAANDFKDAYDKLTKGTATTTDKLTIEEQVLKNLIATREDAGKQSRALVSEEELKSMDEAIASQRSMVKSLQTQQYWEGKVAEASEKAKEKDAKAAELQAEAAARQVEITKARTDAANDYSEEIKKVNSLEKLGVIDSAEAHKKRTEALNKEVQALSDLTVKYGLVSGATVDLTNSQADELNRQKELEKEVQNLLDLRDKEYQSKLDSIALTDKGTEAEKEYIKTIKKAQSAARYYGDIMVGVGESIMNALQGEGDAWKSLGDAVKGVISGVLRALGEQYAVQAAGELAKFLADPLLNATSAAAALKYTLASGAAYVASGAVQAMAEGGSGTVNKPTLFMAGEAGPEDFAFSPKRKGGLSSGTTIIQNVGGSIWREKELEGLAVGAVVRAGRGF